jgi:hypothetical protein
MIASTNGDHPTLEDTQRLLNHDGKHAVLLPIAKGKKGPEWSGWAKMTYAETLNPSYLTRLRDWPNTGVLLGAPSDDLCAIDLDTENALEAFLELNPAFKATFRTRGARGAQLWAYVTGDRPHQVHPLKVDKDSPLALGCEKPPDKEGKNTVGEYRSEGGQSIVRGIHPTGCHYSWLVKNPPITVAFDEIRWPAEVALPWAPKPDPESNDSIASNHSQKTKARSESNVSGSDPIDELLQRAKTRLSIDFLWQYSGFGERRGNPVGSPFRSDNTDGHPSFSIYKDKGSELQRFRDHNSAYEHHRGDAFDFFQLAKGMDAKQAFAPFVELAGLGDELAALKLAIKLEKVTQDLLAQGFAADRIKDVLSRIDQKGSIQQIVDRVMNAILDECEEESRGAAPGQASNQPKAKQGPAAADNSASQNGPQAQQPPDDYTDEELKEFTRKSLEYYQFDDQEFPKLMEATAFYGIAGEIVEVIKVESEAAPEAILGQFLIGFGNIVGRGPYKKQASTHHLNEFGVLVGETSFGRKGTAWDATEELFGILDQGWLSDRVRDGFQSGEAIVHSVRDSRTVYNGKRQSHDPGVADKRLQMMEDEFGRFLMIASRVGNTLSSMTRKAWDAKNWLYTEGKIAPEKATGAHISLIGHITKSELLKCIQEVENQNGFSNRILWIASYRREIIARPQPIFWQRDHADIVARLEKILMIFGNGKQRELDWSERGKLEWDAFYRSLKGSGSSIVGSIIARSAAHVLRLTMLYTVLDRSTLMEPKHLEAAGAFWQYCVRSAQWMFRENTGNKIADRIYWALRRAPKGLTRDRIIDDVFSRNCPKIILEQALNELIKANLATMVVERSAQARKPTQRWYVKNAE